MIEVDNKGTVAELRRYFPPQAVLLNLRQCRDLKPSLFSGIHLTSPFRLESLAIWSIDNTIRCMVLSGIMNDVQVAIAQLEEKDWTLAAIADELHVAHVTVEKWKAGERHTRLEKPVLDALARLLTRKRIPKKRRYSKGGR